MPSVIAVAGALVLVVGSAELSLAKQDGVPGRREGGGTRVERLEKLPPTAKQCGNSGCRSRYAQAQ